MNAFAAALAAFVAGDVALQQCARLPDPWIIAALALAALLVALLALAARHVLPAGSVRRAALLLIGIVAGAAAGGAMAAAAAQARLASALSFADEGRDLRLQGVVAALPTRFEGGVHFLFDVDAVLTPGVTVPGRIALSWYAPAEPPHAAQRWEFTVRLRRPQGGVNPAGFDAEAWMLEQGIRATGSVRSTVRAPPTILLQDRVARFNPLVDRAREALRTRLEALLAGTRYGGVIVALVMGDQAGIAEADWALFNRTGISHLVSISGLHITMIAAACAWLAAGLWRRSARLVALVPVPTVHAIAAIAGGTAYCLLAGWGVPAQRTLLMLVVAALGHAARSRVDASVVLALAGALVCAWDPWAPLTAGFWLSFGAVACLFLAGSGRIATAPGWRAMLAEASHAQAAITVGQIPLTVAIFGQVSLVAPLANAVAIPVVSYAVAPLALAGAACASLGGVPAVAGSWLLAAAEGVFRMLAVFLQGLAAPAWSGFAPPLPPTWALVAAVAGVAWMWMPAGWPLRLLGVCWMLPMFVWPPLRPAPGEAWVTALDVGQGMALVVESAVAVLVFDTGPRFSPDADAAGRVLVPYLRSRGVRTVDLLVVSHQDADHAGGARTLLHAFDVRSTWTSLPAAHPLIAGAVSVQRCVRGLQADVAGVRLQVLSPPEELYERPRASSNAHSCVVLVQAGHLSLLFTGDVPAREERELVDAARSAGMDLHVQVLVAPHHGSHSSSSAELIAATRPRWVSLQLGYRNHFGHPHADVVARYRAAGARLLRSDECGAVQWRFRADGTVRVERWRLDHAHYWHNQPVQAQPGLDQDPGSISDE